MAFKSIQAASQAALHIVPPAEQETSYRAHGRQDRARDQFRRYTSRPYRARTSQRSWSWRPIDRNDRARLIYLAERFEATTNAPRKHGGALKRTGLHILRILLFHFIDCRTGRLDPGLDAIAKRSGCCRATVVSALARLRAAGFLSWTQRVVTVDRGGRRQAVQITNAYKIGQEVGTTGFWPSGWRTNASEYTKWSESTSPTFSKVPEDEGLRTALRNLALRLGWSEQALEEYGLGGNA